jgi:hypothetical protein
MQKLVIAKMLECVNVIKKHFRIQAFWQFYTKNYFVVV